jgi:molybdopterin synthase catalytic subunit
MFTLSPSSQLSIRHTPAEGCVAVFVGVFVSANVKVEVGAKNVEVYVSVAVKVFVEIEV